MRYFYAFSKVLAILDSKEFGPYFLISSLFPDLKAVTSCWNTFDYSDDSQISDTSTYINLPI